MSALLREMCDLEERLLHTDFSNQPQLLEDMLAAEFTEINASGQTGSRAAVCQWLMQKNKAARWRLTEVVVTELQPQMRLVNYHASQIAPVPSASKGALHSSIWNFNQQLQCWQLRFHQATKVL